MDKRVEKIKAKFNKKLGQLNILFAKDKESFNRFGSEVEFIEAQFKAALERFNLSPNKEFMRESILHPYIEMLNEVNVSVEYCMKLNKTDFEAFKEKCQIKHFELIDIVQNMVVPKASVEQFQIDNIDFNILGLTIKELQVKSAELLASMAPEKLCPKIIPIFVEEVCKGYRLNPYHNYTHGFSVAQLFRHIWTTSPSVQKFINKDEAFVGCIASLSHDIGHPGKNNAFHQNTGHYYAKFSLGKSILEHVHAFRTLQVIQHKANVLECFDRKTQEIHRKGIVESILATDMAYHNSCVATLKSKSDIYKGEGNSDECMFLRGALVHAADLNNPCLKLDVYLSWAKLVTQEFHQQTLAEKAAGVDQTPFLIYKNEVGFYKSQIGFCNFFVLPFFKDLMSSFPEITLATRVEDNVSKINEIIKELEAAPEKPQPKVEESQETASPDKETEGQKKAEESKSSPVQTKETSS